MIVDGTAVSSLTSYEFLIRDTILVDPEVESKDILIKFHPSIMKLVVPRLKTYYGIKV